MKRDLKFYLLVLLGGLIFGFGLAFSGMAKPEVVLSFLQLKDLGLLFVMFGAAAVAGIAFEIGSRIEKTAPLTGDVFGKREKSLDKNVVIGAVIFGLGWGLTGICPGAGYASLGIGNYPVLAAMAGMFIGAYSQAIVREKSDIIS